MKDCTIFHFLYYIDYQYVINRVFKPLKDRFLLLFRTVPIHLTCFKIILMRKLFMFLMVSDGSVAATLRTQDECG